MLTDFVRFMDKRMTSPEAFDQDEYPVDPTRWRDSKYAAKPERAKGPFRVAILRRGAIQDSPIIEFDSWENAIQAIIDYRLSPTPGKAEAVAVIGADGEKFPLDFIKGMVARNYDD
jgi:hypothetical protein